MTTGFRPLAVAVAAAHSADQIALAALPLILTAAGASAGIIGLVVAAHSAAWLLMSLPAGALADRVSRRTLMQVGAVEIIAGAAIGWAASAAPVALAAAGFLMSAGVVLIVLSAFAMLPRMTQGHGIARANAIIEFCRALAALTAPLIVAGAIARGYGGSVFAIAIAGGVVSLAASWTMAAEAPQPATRQSMVAAVREGAAFVRDQPILRAIAFCAIAWNAAFFALTAVLAPHATRVLGLTVEDVGRGWAVYGAGLLIGAAVAPYALQRVSTGFLFLFGPASSLFGVALIAGLAPAYGWPVMALGLFSAGFGPMLWLVLQTSVRQMLAPPDMLGRVAATITTAIYGVRPIGALAAGGLAASFGTTVAIWLSVVLFALSVVAIWRSPAPGFRVLADASRSSTLVRQGWA